MLWRAVDTSFCGMARPEPCALRLAVTVTSLMVVSSDIVILKWVLLMGSITVFNPTYEIFRRSFGLLILNEKLPFISVVPAATIRFAASISVTLAIITGPKASLTVPLIMSPALCANELIIDN